MSNNQQLTVKSLLTSDAMKARFTEVLKGKANGFLASVTSQAASGPLANVNPQSVMAAAFIAATLDLPVNRELGFAWIVPYSGQAQFQLGYKGYIQLAQRSGLYSRMNAFNVNADALGGFDDVGEPVILFEKLDDSQPAVGYAFIFRLSNGFTKCVYWSKDKVERHARRYSKAFNSGPWKSNFDEMALKTVARHTLSKWGPLSIEMQSALRHDQGAQVDIDAEVTYPDNGEPEIPAGKVGVGPLKNRQKAIEITDSAGTEAQGSTEGPGAVTQSEPEPVAQESAAPVATPQEKAAPLTEELRAELDEKCKSAGIDTSELALWLAEQGFITKGTAYKNITGVNLKAILSKWEDVRDGFEGR